jgi:hypothetical protein
MPANDAMDGADIGMIVAYFVAVLIVGIWVSVGWRVMMYCT